MAKDDELKKSIKELVKEIVSDAVSKLVRASAMKTVTALRDRIKEKAAKRVEDRLKKTAKELKKELISDTAKDADYVSEFNKAFEERFQKLLTSLSKGLLQPLIIASACALVVGGAIGGLVVYNTIEPTEPIPPPPQPDLVIIGVEPVWTGESILITYTIKNQGDVEAGASCTCLYRNGNPDPISEDCIGSIAPGDYRVRSFPAYSISPEDAYIHLDIRADGYKSVAESNEENNLATITHTIHTSK